MKNYRGVRKWLNAVLVLGVAGMLLAPLASALACQLWRLLRSKRAEEA